MTMAWTASPAALAEREPLSSWFVRVLLGVSAAAIATDITIANSLGGGGAGSLLSSLVLAAPLVVAAVLHFGKEGRIRPTPLPLFAMLAYALWAAASVFWATGDQKDVLIRVMTNAQLLAYVWLSWQIVRSESELRVLLLGYVAGCAILVALTWRNYFAGVLTFWDRYAADGFDPNEMAIYLALGIPMAAYLAASGRVFSKFALIYLPLALSGVALSGSRGGLLCSVVAIAGVLVWLARRSRAGSTLMLLSLALGVAFAAAWVPAESWTRMFSVGDELSGGTAGDRKQIWRAAWDVLQRHPVIGVGAGGFPDAVVPALHLRIVAHSTQLEIAVELGIIGLVLFLTAYVLVLWHVGRSSPNDRSLAWCLIATWFVGSSSLSWEYRKPTWFVLLIAIVLGGLRHRSGNAPQAMTAQRSP